MMLAWLKLRKRNLGPLLNACLPGPVKSISALGTNAPAYKPPRKGL